MGLREDLQASGLNTGDYLRKIWEETAFSGDQFSEIVGNIDDVNDVELIKQTLIRLINDIEGSTGFRRGMYRCFLNEFFRTPDQYMNWVEVLQLLNISREEKWKYVAYYLTRVIRGNIFNTLNPPPAATRLLVGGLRSVWNHCVFMKLETLCAARRI